MQENSEVKYRTINGWTKAKMIETIRKNNNGTRAFDSVESECMYLTTDGNRCAVGCFIPDDFLNDPPEHDEDPFMYVGAADGLLEKFPFLRKFMPVEVEALEFMQSVHDDFEGEGDIRDRLTQWIEDNVEDAGISSSSAI